MDITSLLVQLISGAIGGNAAGAVLKKSSLGPIGNSIAGILGGGVGSQILAALGSGGMAAGTPLAIESIISNMAGGGVGGAVIIAIIGALRKSMAAKAGS